MKCPKCGAEIINGDKFCMNCGTPVDNMTISNTNSQYTGNSSAGMYNDSNTNLNDTMSSDAYTPNSNNYIQNNYSNDNMIGPENKVDVAVRRYFLGYKDITIISILVFFFDRTDYMWYRMFCRWYRSNCFSCTQFIYIFAWRWS